jgi:hypothetical protein
MFTDQLLIVPVDTKDELTTASLHNPFMGLPFMLLKFCPTGIE